MADIASPGLDSKGDFAHVDTAFKPEAVSTNVHSTTVRNVSTFIPLTVEASKSNVRLNSPRRSARATSQNGAKTPSSFTVGLTGHTSRRFHADRKFLSLSHSAVLAPMAMTVSLG